MYTRKEIFAQLEALGVPQDRPVTIHTSLRAIGEVEGRGEGLLDMLIEYVTAKGGLLCVPTHTHGNLYNDRIITLDFWNLNTNIGTFPTIAIRDGRGVHSVNPSHSMTMFGDREKAERYAAYDKTIRTCTSPEGCYGRLAAEDGYVLLAGVGQDKNTYLHCVEEMLNLPDRMTRGYVDTTIRYPDGTLEHFPLRTYIAWMTALGDTSHRFPMYEPAFRYHGCIRDGKLGDADTQLCSAKGMAEVARKIWENSGGIDFLGKDWVEDLAIDEKYYR